MCVIFSTHTHTHMSSEPFGTMWWENVPRWENSTGFFRKKYGIKSTVAWHEGDIRDMVGAWLVSGELSRWMKPGVAGVMPVLGTDWGWLIIDDHQQKWLETRISSHGWSWVKFTHREGKTGMTLKSWRSSNVVYFSHESNAMRPFAVSVIW